MPASSYTVAVLGDTHYDAEPEGVYHSHYDESNRWAEIQHKEFRRNGEMWRARCPRLLAASAALAREEGADFVLQLGDVIQGDCDDVPTHQKMLADCIAMLRRPYPAGLPFLTVVGNHDVRGKGAREAYFDFAQAFMGGEVAALTGGAAASARYPVFSFPVGPDRWIFCDFECRDLQPAIDAVEGAGDARHVFLVAHGPFTTPDAGHYRWRLGGRTDCDALRPRLYEALSRRHAVVLSGHTHDTTFYRHETAGGGFTEFTANSVWATEELAYGGADCDSPEGYGRASAGQHADQDDFESQLAFFRPGLREYFCSRAAGHARLEVGDNRVELAFYPGDARREARRWRMK